MPAGKLRLKLHSQVEVARTPEEQQALNKKWEAEGDTLGVDLKDEVCRQHVQPGMLYFGEAA